MSHSNDIGHVHLRVAEIDRALSFYRDLLGLEPGFCGLVTRRPSCLPAATTTRIALNTWHSRGGSPPEAGSAGLYHVATRFPTREMLARTVRRCIDGGITITGAADEGFAEAMRRVVRGWP